MADLPRPPGRVLYVEDNHSNIVLMQRLFQERPELELLIAQDGDAARTLTSEASPNLVFMDLNLPDISGEDLIPILREESADALPPIVVLSADATAEKIERLSSLGIAGYLTKPYDIHELFRIVDTYCPPQETRS